MHRLTTPNFIDPRWFNLMQRGPSEGIAIDATHIEVNGETLRLVEPTITLEPGEKVIVTLTRNFLMETAKEHQERIEKQRQAYEEEHQRYIEEEMRRDKEAKRFNASLNIPVRWRAGIKDVLSGLTENSNGNGWNKATKVHVYLLESLQEGRFHRNAHDFLCTSESGNNGKNWSGRGSIAEEWIGRDNEIHEAKVTCKTCLKLAQRWKREEENG